eukprot:SAG22_NODE_1244_length_5021_cov_16.855547_1_plen_96_part_10
MEDDVELANDFGARALAAMRVRLRDFLRGREPDGIGICNGISNGGGGGGGGRGGGGGGGGSGGGGGAGGGAAAGSWRWCRGRSGCCRYDEDGGGGG